MRTILINDKQEYDDVAHAELINQLDILINKKHACTKYNALNVQTGITIDEKKILETVLDIIREKYPDKADGLISTIIKKIKNVIYISRYSKNIFSIFLSYYLAFFS